MHFIFNIIIYVSFSQFLNDNFDYDELTALEQLSAYGLKNFMFDVAKVSERGVGKLIKNSHLQMLFTSNSHPARLLIWDLWSLNPSHPNISMHILHTVAIKFLRCWQGEFVYQSRKY